METGFMNRITGLVIALVIGGLLVGGLLAPTVAGIQDTVGDKITKSNQVYTGYYIEPSAEYELIINADGWTANGVSLTNQNYRQLVFADTFVVQANTNIDSTAFGYIMAEDMTAPRYLYVTDNAEYTITFNDKTMTVVKTGTDAPVYTKTYNWAFTACGAGEPNAWGTITRVGTNNAFILNDSQFYLSGYYYTGENKTFYSYHNGNSYTGEYEGNVTFEKEKVAGTTDIYNITQMTVTIGGEEFNPYLILVPLSVTGHATAGPYYVMFGVLTLLAIVMLVVVAANGIRNKY